MADGAREKGKEVGGRKQTERERERMMCMHLQRRKREVYSAKVLRGTYLANEA